MRAEIRKAAAPTAARKHIVQRRKSYTQARTPSMEIFRAEHIRKHRTEIPIIHRQTYDRAMKGKSLKSAIKSFCLECCCWQKEEVRLCTSLACPLFPYRPYKKNSKRASEGLSFGRESQNSGQEDQTDG
jgi:hypothetical protein